MRPVGRVLAVLAFALLSAPLRAQSTRPLPLPDTLYICQSYGPSPYANCVVLDFHGTRSASSSSGTATLQRFDSAGLLVSIKDPRGVVQTYTGKRTARGFTGTYAWRYGRVEMMHGRWAGVALAPVPAALARLGAKNVLPQFLNICQTNPPPPPGTARCIEWTRNGWQFNSPAGATLTVQSFDAGAVVLKGIDRMHGRVFTFSGKGSGKEIRGSAGEISVSGSVSTEAWTASNLSPSWQGFVSRRPVPVPAPTVVAAGESAGLNWTYRNLIDPGHSIVLVGVNDSGVVLGYVVNFFSSSAYDSVFGSAPQTFVYQHGQFTLLTGAIFDSVDIRRGSIVRTYPIAINNRGTILVSRQTSVVTNYAHRGTLVEHAVYYLYSLATHQFRPVGSSVAVKSPAGSKNVALQIVGFNDRDEILGRNDAFRVAYDYSFFFGEPAIGPVGSTTPPVTSVSLQPLPPCPNDETMQANAAINDRDQIVGTCLGDSSAHDLPFVYDHGAFKFYSLAGTGYVFPSAITNSGRIVGRYEPPSGAWCGFEYDGSHFSCLTPPGATVDEYLKPAAVNDQGEIVGTWSVGGVQMIATPASAAGVATASESAPPQNETSASPAPAPPPASATATAALLQFARRIDANDAAATLARWSDLDALDDHQPAIKSDMAKSFRDMFVMQFGERLLIQHASIIDRVRDPMARAADPQNQALAAAYRDFLLWARADQNDTATYMNNLANSGRILGVNSPQVPVMERSVRLALARMLPNGPVMPAQPASDQPSSDPRIRMLQSMASSAGAPGAVRVAAAWHQLWLENIKLAPNTIDGYLADRVTPVKAHLLRQYFRWYSRELAAAFVAGYNSGDRGSGAALRTYQTLIVDADGDSLNAPDSLSAADFDFVSQDLALHEPPAVDYDVEVRLQEIFARQSSDPLSPEIQYSLPLSP